MSGQKELWIILHDEEYNTIWDKFQEEFQFQPQYGQYDKPTFVFNMPVDVYDIKDSPIYDDSEDLNDIIRNGFILAMDDDDFMYAFDYNHTSYRYNPRINTVIEYPVWISDERYKPNGGYNAYFPEFYPDGDYYFFIAKDFRWGYLTHPWLEKVWVFGNRLMAYFREHSEILKFNECNDI